MARKRLALIVAAGVISVAAAAYADQPTIDITAIGKLSEQINKMAQQLQTAMDQLTQLKQQTDFLDQVNSAVGKAATITLPITSADNIAAQLKSNLQCLMPNGLSWGINTKDLDLGSICNATQTYHDALFVNDQPKDDNSAGTSGGPKPLTYAELDAQRQQVAQRRQALLADTTIRSLAMSDVQAKQASETNQAADELKTAADAAATEQERLAVLLNIQTTILRSQAQQTQILAQMLKLQSAMALNAGVTKEDIKKADEANLTGN